MGLVLRNLPFPFGEPISKPPRAEFKAGQDPQAGFMTLAWINAFTALFQQINQIPVTAASVSLNDQAAAIPATDMTEGKLNTGEYRLSWYAAVTTAASVSSSLQIEFDWEYRGVTQNRKGTALVANDPTEFDTDVILITVDGNTPVRYTVGYAQVGTPMAYDIRVCLENVPL